MNRAMDILADQEAKVADLRKEADEAVRRVEKEEDVLRGMRLMAEHTPASAFRAPEMVSQSFGKNGSLVVSKVVRRGRQLGAISHEWRCVLKELYTSHPGYFTLENVVNVAHENDLPKIWPRDAEDRMGSYLRLGYVERLEDGYRVSEAAAQKYGFSRQTTEAPTADAEGAS